MRELSTACLPADRLRAAIKSVRTSQSLASKNIAYLNTSPIHCILDSDKISTYIQTKGEGMNIAFRTRRLERAYEESARAIRLWGEPGARKYITRIVELINARDFDDIKKLAALRAHPLRGKREGQWAIDMTDRWRLIVERSAVGNEVTILEVSRHYGD